MHALAHRAVTGLAGVIVLALSTFAVSYRRHRTLLMEGASGPSKERRRSVLLGWLLPDPRQQGAAGFMLHTLARSGHHRMILMGYGGVAFALILRGITGLGSWVDRERLAPAGFVYFHVIVLLFLLIGARHLFSLPTELKANWVFQITEREARGEWLRAVDRLVFFWGALLLVAPLPLELHWLGWRGIAEAALSSMVGLLAYDWFFSSWNKLPFTCSHLPGKTPGWMLALQFFAVIALIPVLQTAILATLYSPFGYGFAMSAIMAAWVRVHALRHDSRGEVRLKYDEAPEPAIHGLNLQG